MNSDEWWDDVIRKVIGGLIIFVATSVITWFFVSKSSLKAGEELGFVKGKAEGYAEALAKCKDKDGWLEEGRAAGHTTGFKEGQSEGLAAGKKQGVEEAYQRGKDDGLRIGSQFSIARFLESYESHLTNLNRALSVYKDNRDPSELRRAINAFLGAIQQWGKVLEKLSHFQNSDIAALIAELSKDPPDFAKIEQIIQKLFDNYKDRRDATFEELKAFDRLLSPPVK